MNLSNDERLQSGAIKIKTHLAERLESLRKSNDEPMAEPERMALIGEIAAVKNLLRFIDTKPVALPDDSRFDD